MIEAIIDAARAKREDLATIADATTRAVVVVGALSYGVGLVIVNGHLLRYGVHAISVLRADYIMAGVLWAVLVAIPLFAVLGARRTWDYVKRDWAERRRGLAVLKSVLSIVVMPGLLYFPLMVLTGRPAQLGEWQYWGVVGTIWYSAVGILFAGATVATHTRTWTTKGAHVVEFPIYEVAFQCFWLISTVGLYSRVVYPSILPMYGGGRPAAVRLIPAPGAADTLRSLSLGLDTPTDGPPAVELIAESDDWLVLARLNRQGQGAMPVRVKRDLIAAIELVEPHRK